MPGLQAAFRPQKLLDLAEQGVVLALYAWLVARLWPRDFSTLNVVADWDALLLLASEGLVVVLLVVRRPAGRISQRLGDWLVAAAGTFVVLLVQPGGAQASAELGLALIVAGIAVHVGAKLSLWRSFGVVAANRGVKTGGLYALVRHPMYAGYVLAHAGYLLAAPSWWNLAVYLTAWLLLFARIEAEERTLREDAGYAAYMTRVRWRLLPGVY